MNLKDKIINVLGDSITAFEDCSNGVAAGTANSTLAGGRVWFPMTGRQYDSEGKPKTEILILPVAGTTDVPVTALHLVQWNVLSPSLL